MYTAKLTIVNGNLPHEKKIRKTSLLGGGVLKVKTRIKAGGILHMLFRWQVRRFFRKLLA